MDLDRFKKSTTPRPHYGDLLLLELGALQGVFANADTAARLGGDEFAVLLPRANAPMPKSPRGAARRSNNLPVRGIRSSRGSIGISVFPSTALTRTLCCARLRGHVLAKHRPSSACTP